MLEQRGCGGTERCVGTGRNRSHYEEESHLDSSRRKHKDLAKFSNQSENTGTTVLSSGMEAWQKKNMVPREEQMIGSPAKISGVAEAVCQKCGVLRGGTEEERGLGIQNTLTSL